MTIVVGVATPEGIVLASDSRTTQTFPEDRHRIASDNAQKIFEVDGMGVATYGLAFIATDTIAGVMDQFAAHVADRQLDVEELASELGVFFNERFEGWLKESDETWDLKADGEALGFLVAGYDADGVGSIIQVSIPNGATAKLSTTTEGGMMWRGQTDVIRRLIKGVDRPCLLATGFELSDDQEQELTKLEYSILQAITLQDGIDFASFLVRTTIDMQRFSDGTFHEPGEIPGCGGPLQLLAIERSRHVWIRALTLHGPSQPGLAEGAAS